MSRSARGTWGRGAATLALTLLFQCTFLFDLGGLDDGPSADGAGDGGDGRADEGAVSGDGPADVASDETASVPGDDAGDADTSSEADARDAAADADAAVADADADAGCVTSFAGDASQVLFPFDAHDVPGWVSVTNSGGPSALLGWTASDGHSCPGALTMDVGFKAYDGNSAHMQFTYGPGASWHGARLHAWVKLVTRGDGGAADYLGLGSAELFVLSNGWSNYSFVLEDVNPSFGDGDWHEIVLDFARDGGHAGRSGPDVVTTSIQQVGVVISSGTSRPVGGPASPPMTLVLLDDIWIE